MSTLKKEYPLFKVHIQSEEALSNIKEVFESGFINEGLQVTQLTKAIEARFNTEHVCLTNSCTSAITMAIRLSTKDVSCLYPGESESLPVITSPMTCVASNMPILNTGNEIVWADVEPNTGMIDPKDVDKILTELDFPAPVIAVAWAGSPPKLNELRRVCDKHGSALILDAAHAFDARYDKRYIHSIPDFTAYSFQAIKHFTTGDGGALICKDEMHHQLAQEMKWFGINRNTSKDSNGNWKGKQWDVDIDAEGYKFNMNNIAAAIGLSQLNHIDDIIIKHRLNAETYDSMFKDNSDFVKLTKRSSKDSSSFWVYTMFLNTTKQKKRDKLLTKLQNLGIKAGVVHVPNHRYSCFNHIYRDLPGVDKFYNKQFSLPCGWWLDSYDIKEIANTTLKVAKEILK